MKPSWIVSTLCIASLAGQLNATEPGKIPIQGEILDGWQREDGTRVAAIRLTMAPGWHTYWRSPGDAGIPPDFDWQGSGNMARVGITWPTPMVFEQEGMRSIGYENEVVLPLAIAPKQPAKPVKLHINLNLGVCKDLCMPQTLELEAVLDSTASKPTAVIASALAQRPFSAQEAGVKQAVCALSPADQGLSLEAQIKMPDTGGKEVVVIETGQVDTWVSPVDSNRQSGQLTATANVVPMGNSLAIDRSDIRITILGRKHAVEITGCEPG